MDLGTSEQHWEPKTPTIIPTVLLGILTVRGIVMVFGYSQWEESKPQVQYCQGCNVKKMKILVGRWFA